MGDVIELIPNKQHSLVIHSSRKGYHALWYIGEELLWEYESEHLTEIKDFAQAMIERMNDDTGTPLQGS